MRFIAAAFITLAVGVGVGLLTFGLAQPDYESAASQVRVGKLDASTQNYLDNERRRAVDRATVIGAGAGFLSAGAVALLLYIGTGIFRRAREAAEPRRGLPMNARSPEG
jgi:hypothetical protein